jgi:hypothetical protein
VIFQEVTHFEKIANFGLIYITVARKIAMLEQVGENVERNFIGRNGNVLNSRQNTLSSL